MRSLGYRINYEIYTSFTSAVGMLLDRNGNFTMHIYHSKLKHRVWIVIEICFPLIRRSGNTQKQTLVTCSLGC